MRRLTASRAWAAVAVVAAVVAVLAVMFPGLGFGQTTSVKGGSPSAVYMKKNLGVCSEVVPDGVNVMEQDITLDAPSHVLIYFTFSWGELDIHERGLLNLSLDGTSDNFEWSTLGNTNKITGGTVMWPFANVTAGQHTVTVGAFVDPTPPGGETQAGGEPTAFLANCALTVFVTPIAD